MGNPLTFTEPASNLALSYQNVITGSKSSSAEDPIGGMLADDMGLGKTLSTLALIVGSKARAVEFALNSTRTSFESWLDNVPAKCTLVVVPSARKFTDRGITAFSHV